MNFLQLLTPPYPNISIRFRTLFPPTPFPDLLWGALLPFIYDPSFCISLYSTVQEFCSIIYSLPLYIYLKTSPSFCFIASIYNHFPAVTLFKQTQNFMSLFIAKLLSRNIAYSLLLPLPSLSTAIEYIRFLLKVQE